MKISTITGNNSLMLNVSVTQFRFCNIMCIDVMIAHTKAFYLFLHLLFYFNFILLALKTLIDLHFISFGGISIQSSLAKLFKSHVMNALTHHFVSYLS